MHGLSAQTAARAAKSEHGHRRTFVACQQNFELSIAHLLSNLMREQTCDAAPVDGRGHRVTDAINQQPGREMDCSWDGEPCKGRKAPKVEAKLSQLGQITRLELMEEPSTASFGDIHNQVNHKRATCFLTKQLVVCCAVLLLTSRGRFGFARVVPETAAREMSRVLECMMLQLFGSPISRAMRCLWMLEEMGAPYKLIERSTRAEDLRTAEYLRLNPNARIPTLVDGEVVLWESMAINLYLAQKYEGPMHCAKSEMLGLATQWSFWAVLEMEALLLELLQHRALLPVSVRDPSYAERDELLLKRPLSVLNGCLAGDKFLVGENFTVADLNVASILAWGKMSRLDLSAHPEVTRWLDKCLSRPAYVRVRETVQV
jgi:glutathione S-transferase